MDKKEYMKKFRRCILEYTSPAGAFDVSEDGEDDMMQGGAPGGDMGGDMGSDMGGDPNAMGGAPGDDMGGDPNAMGGAPGDDMGGDPNAMGDGSNAQPPQGFSPQGGDPNAGIDGMGGDPNAMGSDPNAMGGMPGDDMGSAPEGAGPDDEVIDVDDLTNSQEETEKKIDALSGKFEKLMSSLDGLEKRISDIDAHTNEYLGRIENEFDKRNPTPMQRMTMRSTKSAPYAMTPNEYMNNYAPENYSDADDNNGADDPQYKITKGDIDDFTDYSSIANEFNGKMGLHDILGY